MPGQLNTYAGTDFLSPLRLFRVTRDSDVDAASVVETLDFTKSKSGRRNHVLIVPNRNEGAGRINYQFYAKHSGELGELVDPWILHKSTGLVVPLTIVLVTDLFAAPYKVRAVHENGATAEFETYLSAGVQGTFPTQLSPSALSVNYAGANPVLTWTGPVFPNAADDIEIYVSTGRSVPVYLATVAADSGPYTDLTNLSSDLTIHYSVRALSDTNGPSALTYSVPRQMEIIDVDNAVDTELTITWVVNTGDVPAVSLGVEIWRSHEGAPFELLTTVPFSPAIYTDVGLTTDDHYDYMLREVNVAGNGPFSVVDGATVVGGN